jgi:hypothetical protein
VSKTIGRNERCPCGSGKKFKKCHGAPASPSPPLHSADAIGQKLKEIEVSEIRRQRLQGLGRPIISDVLGDLRVVAVGSRLYWSAPGKWKTFHDFLISYLRRILGGEWAEKELRAAARVRHPLLNWYEQLSKLLTKTVVKSGEIGAAPATGAASAFLFLAYDLYLIAHNVSDESFHARLFKRLKSKDHFLPAGLTPKKWT